MNTVALKKRRKQGKQICCNCTKNINCLAWCSCTSNVKCLDFCEGIRVEREVTEALVQDALIDSPSPFAADVDTTRL